MTKGDCKQGGTKKRSVLTSVLTGAKSQQGGKRFQRVGHGLFRFKRTGMLYGVFKSAGRTRWKCLNTDDFNHARELLAEEIKHEVKVDWKRSRTVTLRKLIEHYETNPMNLAGSTLKIRMMLLDVFKKTWPFGLGLRMREIKPFMLRSWLAEQRKKRNLKSAGANNYLRMLHGLFGLAVDLGAVSENTAHEIQLVREENPERLTPTWEQAQEIIVVVKRPKSKIALTAMLLLGLGQGELRNLRGEHFDLDQNTITVRRQKTQKVFRIPIYPQARSFIEKLRDEGSLENGRQVFQVCNPREAISLACQRMKLPVFSPRSFRRAFIIRALEKGIDPRVVAAWQGHRDSSFFSPTSTNQRIRGVELYERLARRFVEEMLSVEPGQILKLNDAFAVFRGLLKEKELPDIKRSDFKAVVVPLVRDQFNVCLRNDLGNKGGRGWKNVKMLPV